MAQASRLWLARCQFGNMKPAMGDCMSASETGAMLRALIVANDSPATGMEALKCVNHTYPGFDVGHAGPMKPSATAALNGPGWTARAHASDPVVVLTGDGTAR